MKNRITYLISLSCLIFSFSCQKQSERAKELTDQAESIMEEYPDSALLVLKGIKNPESLPKNAYYYYYLIQIQAKDKAYEDITSDTIITKVQKYYSDKHNLELAALATFYCGRVKQEQQDYDKALQVYLGAEDYLSQIDNDNLKGLFAASIGGIYYEQLLTNKAIEYYRYAKVYFKKVGNSKNEISISNYLGNCFLIQEQVDSAFIYYNDALNVAAAKHLLGSRNSILESMGVAFRESKNLIKSKECFYEAMSHYQDSIDLVRVACNLAKVYEQMGVTDSAFYYLNIGQKYLPSKDNNYFSANIYKTWSAIHEEEKDYKKALAKYKLYSKHLAMIISENKNRTILEIEGKYQYERLNSQNKKLLIERQQLWLLLLVTVLVLLIVLFVSYRKSLLKERNLIEAENKIYQLKEMVCHYNEKEVSSRNILIQHFDILKKTALLETYLKDDEKQKGKKLLQKFNEVVYGERTLDWDLLYKKMNTINNNSFDYIRNALPQLDESEFRICCLIYSDFKNTEIALALNYGVNTVQVKKSAIRKKLRITSYGNIRDYLSNLIDCR